MLGNPLASQELGSLVGEVVAVVLEQVIPVPPEPVPALGLQVLQEQVRAQLSLTKLNNRCMIFVTSTNYSIYLLYFERLSKLCSTWRTLLYPSPSKEVFLGGNMLMA